VRRGESAVAGFPAADLGYRMDVTIVSVDLPDGIAALLDDEALAEGSLREDVAREAIFEHLRARRPDALVDAISSHLALDDRDLIAGLRGRG
jgi:hypothetical protein